LDVGLRDARCGDRRQDDALVADLEDPHPFD
jgi:hypothetical protein